MGQWSFVHSELIHLIWAAAALVILLVVLELRAGEQLGRFLSSVMQTRLASRQSLTRRILRIALILVALSTAVVALMRPQTPGTVESISTRRASADIMVVLDVSRSMLAEDTAPSRLARASAEVSELLTHLHSDRVGLVAFAGRAVLLCPLTLDQNFFRMILRGVNTDTVTRGGTQIGVAIRRAIEGFPQGDRAKLILLITDGEDHDSFPLDAAQEALEAGIRIVTIGFGSEDGSEITITDPDTGARSILVDNSGVVVRSRLDGELLRDIAVRTEGAYVPAGVAALDLDSIVEAHIEPLTRDTASENLVRVVPGEQYHWFILASLMALVGVVWIGSTGGRRGIQ